MLRIPDNKVYILHPLTVEDKNFVEISPQQAKNLLEGRSLMEGLTYEDIAALVPDQGRLIGNQSIAQTASQVTELAYLKQKLGVALELLGLSKPDQLPDDLTEGKVVMDNLEIPPNPDPDSAVTEQGPPTGIEEKDPDITMLEQIRADGKGKSKVEAYILRNYSIAVDPKAKLDELVNMAIGLREKALEEVNLPEGTTETQAPVTAVPPDAEGKPTVE
jgi:hypothetical protein